MHIPYSHRETTRVRELEYKNEKGQRLLINLLKHVKSTVFSTTWLLRIGTLVPAKDDCGIILKQLVRMAYFSIIVQSDVVFKLLCCKFSDMFALCEVWIMFSNLAHTLI